MGYTVTSFLRKRKRREEEVREIGKESQSGRKRETGARRDWRSN